MAAKLYFNPFIPAFSSNGAPVAGAKLNVYLTGTTTRTPIYSDEALTVEHPNPVIADAAGKYPNIYLDGDIVYKVVQTDRNDAPIGDAIDPYIPGVMSSGAEAFAINAQNYADAAALAAAAVGVYTTVGAGESATTNGQSFYVASGGDVTLYLNNAGTGDEVASIVTTAKLASTDPGEGSALVGYQQTDTGSIPVTMADRSRPLIHSFEFIADSAIGTADNTAAVQNMLNAAPARHLVIHPGEYRISTTGLDVLSNSTITFMPGAVFKMEDTDTLSYRMLRIENVEDVVLFAPVLDGNQSGSTSTTPGAVYGISINTESKRIRIYNPVTNEFYTDGININSASASVRPDDVYILNHRADRCRRQGLSVSSGENITVDKPIYSNIGGPEIHGQLPGAGIDIEPGSMNQVAKNIRVIDPVTINCRRGIVVDLHNLLDKPTLVNEADVQIIRAIDYGSEIPFVGSVVQSGTTANTGLRRGRIVFDSPHSYDSVSIPFSLAGLPGVCPVIVKNPYISEPNTGGSAGVFSTIFFIAAQNPSGSITTGGVHIFNPEIHSKDTSVARLWNPGAGGADVADCSLIDPLFIEPRLLTETPAFGQPPSLAGGQTSEIKMSDSYRQFVRTFTSTVNLTSYPPPQVEMVTVGGWAVTLPVAQSSYNHAIEFRWMPGSGGANGTFKPQTGDVIIGLGAGMTGMRTTLAGSTITFEQIAEGFWSIKSKAGVWEEVA